MPVVTYFNSTEEERGHALYFGPAGLLAKVLGTLTVAEILTPQAVEGSHGWTEGDPYPFTAVMWKLALLLALVCYADGSAEQWPLADALCCAGDQFSSCTEHMFCAAATAAEAGESVLEEAAADER